MFVRREQKAAGNSTPIDTNIIYVARIVISAAIHRRSTNLAHSKRRRRQKPPLHAHSTRRMQQQRSHALIHSPRDQHQSDRNRDDKQRRKQRQQRGDDEIPHLIRSALDQTTISTVRARIGRNPMHTAVHSGEYHLSTPDLYSPRSHVQLRLVSRCRLNIEFDFFRWWLQATEW